MKRWEATPGGMSQYGHGAGTASAGQVQGAPRPGGQVPGRGLAPSGRPGVLGASLCVATTPAPALERGFICQVRQEMKVFSSFSVTSMESRPPSLRAAQGQTQALGGSSSPQELG